MISLVLDMVDKEIRAQFVLNQSQLKQMCQKCMSQVVQRMDDSMHILTLRFQL